MNVHAAQKKTKPQVVVEVYRGERVHHDVVEELEVGALPVEGDVLGEEDVGGGGDGHVDEDEDHEGVEVARAPVQGEQHEGQEAGYHLGKECDKSNRCRK